MASVADKLLLAPAIGLVFAKTVSAAAGGALFGTGLAPTYGEHVLQAFARSFISALTPQQLQWLFPTTINGYKAWCIKHKITPDVCKIPSPTGDVDGLWFGDKKLAKYYMVYYHGGGFVMPGHNGHWDLCQKLVQWSNNSLAVMSVDYSLSPEALYPVALAQCVDGVRYILTQPGVSASNLLLGGDSAGGNLVLGVLSHILHPHPKTDIVNPLKLDQPLMGGLLISPWISDDVQKYQSFQKYANRDGFGPDLAVAWSDNYKGGRDVPNDNYMWPSMADAAWWAQSPIKSIFTTIGEHEICFDAAEHWAQKYKQNNSVDVYVGKSETHIQPVMQPLPEAELLKAPEESVEGSIMLWVKKTMV